MDSFEINKIIAAILVTVLLVFGIGKISEIIFHTEKPDVQGYKVEIKVEIKVDLDILDCFISPKTDIASCYLIVGGSPCQLTINFMRK